MPYIIYPMGQGDLTWIDFYDAAAAQSGSYFNTLSEINTAFDSALAETAVASGSAGPVASSAIVASEASEALVVASGDAAAAFSAYEVAGGAVSELSAAVGAETSKALAPIAVQSGSSGFSLTGLLAADVGVIGAAIAPLAGLALGVGLYELAPEFWTELSQAILPWAYEDSGKAPVVVDGDGKTYLDGNLVDALINLLSQYGDVETYDKSSLPTTSILVYPDANYYVYAYDTIIMSQTSGNRTYVYTSQGNKLFVLNSGTAWVVTAGGANNNPLVRKTYDSGVLTETVNLNMASFSSSGYSWYARGDATPTQSSYTNNYEVSGPYSGFAGRDIAAIIAFGTGSIDLPDGMSSWSGNTISDPSVGAIDVVTGYTDPDDPTTYTTTPFYPVSLPNYNTSEILRQQTAQKIVDNNPDISYEDAYNSLKDYFYLNPSSVDSTTQPDPTTPVDQGEQVDPYFDIDAIPINNPVPNYNPIPGDGTEAQDDPDTIEDSQPYAEPETQSQPDVITPVPPTSSGTTTAPPDDPGITPLIDPSFDITATNPGLITVYNPTAAELQAFASWLWVSWQSATLQTMWNNPFDGVIGLHELYATPNTDAAISIKSGFLDSGVTAATVPNRYSMINCGNIVIPEYYGNYLDYAPYSQAYIYLPFIGIVQLDCDDIVGHAVNVTYYVDAYTGTCIAQITVARSDYSSLCYQYTGNCAVEIPLAGGTQASIKAGLLMAAANGISSVIGGIASMIGGNVGGGVSEMGYGAANAFANVVQAKSTVQHSGSFGGNPGAMGVKKPYIIIKRPVQVPVENYNLEYGFPAHKFVRIGACTGFLRVRECNVISSTATNEEKEKIEELLKGGVFVQ